MSGTGRIRLMASDTNKVWRIVAAHDVDGADGAAVRLVAPIDRFVDGGGMWVELSTETGELTVVRRAVERSHRAPAADHRSWCAPTTGSRTASTPCRPWPTTRRRWRRVDVGRGWSTRAATRWSRARASRRSPTALGDRLRYLRQPNLGGAGGFTRGMYDATAGDPAEHATCCSWTTTCCSSPRSWSGSPAFADSTAHPTIVGGQMLNLLHPAHLHITAEYAEPESSGRAPMPGALKEAYLLGQDERRAADEAGPPRRHRVQRLVVVPDPGRGRAGDRLPAAAVLPVGRHRVRLPRPRARLPHRRAARRRRLARRLRVEGLGRVAPVLQHAQRPDHRRAAHRLLRSGSAAGSARCSASTWWRCSTALRSR